MAKALRDIVPKLHMTVDKKLEGVKSSKTVDGSTGVDPGVDYAPKAPAEQEFVALHKTEKHADRAGNDEKLYNASNIKYSLKTPQNSKMGRDKDESKKVYEEAKPLNDILNKKKEIE